MAIGMLNLLAGWTGLGWVGALVWACTTDVGAMRPQKKIFTNVSGTTIRAVALNGNPPKQRRTKMTTSKIALELVNDTVERLCRLGAESVQRYAQVSGRDVRYKMLECFTQSHILANFDRDAKIDMEVGIGDLTTTFPGAETMARFPRFDLVFYNENKPYAVVELKNGWIENNDRIRLRTVLPYIVNKPAGIVASYMIAADAQQFKKEMEEQRPTSVTSGLNSRSPRPIVPSYLPPMPFMSR